MNTKKAVNWLIIAFVVFFIITQPAELAHIVRSVLHILHQAATSITTLIRDL